MAGLSTSDAALDVRALVTGNLAAAGALSAGLLVIFQPRNSNALVRSFAGSWMTAVAVAAALMLAVLQLSTVAPFLYFNF